MAGLGVNTAAAANPQVTPGSTVKLIPNLSKSPASGGWAIYDPTSTLIACAGPPTPGTNGWAVTAATGQNSITSITVTVPANASLGTGYEAAYNGPSSINAALFDVVAPPSAPTFLTATAGDQSVHLSWTGVSGAVSYSVYRGLSTGGESAAALVTGLTSPSYTDSGLTNGITYYYVITASSTIGEGHASSEANARPAVQISSTSTINDTDSGLTYTGSGWFYSAARGFLDYNDDEHATNTIGDSVSYTFSGTGIAFLGESSSGGGNVKVYLDGTLQATVSTYSASRQAQQTQWSITGLTSGSHTLKLVMQDGSYMEVDAVQVTAISSLTGTGLVRFYPRAGYSGRMMGGKFQGSNDGSTYTDLYTIGTQPVDGQWTAATLPVDPINYRYLRYLAPNGSFGNIAELAFYSGSGASAIQLTGTAFGTPTSYGNTGNDCTKAFDGSTSTFFDAPVPGNGDYVGIDQYGAPLGSQALAINAGGGAAGSFAADTGYSGGTPFSATTAIDVSGVASPAPQAVYQSQRYGNFTYTLPGLTPGSLYLLRLHFAETYFTASNMRRFSVSANGTQILSNFDIFDSAGGANRALVESFPVAADGSGQITVQFTNGSVDNAAVNGLEVLKFPPAAASQVRFVPRPAYESRMVGGKFQGSNDGSSYTDLATVMQTPARGEFTTLTLSAPATYRYLRYLSPDNGYGNISELEFDNGSGANAVKIAGTGYGTPGSYNNYGNDFTKVFDGDWNTFFDAPEAISTAYVGIDQGSVPPLAIRAVAGSGSVALTWGALTGVTGYNVYRATAPGGPFVSAGNVAGTASSFLNTGLTSGTTYYYFVTSLSVAGESLPSNTAHATPTDPAPDFGIAASPDKFGITPTGTAATAVTVTPLGAFSGSVTLSISGLPATMTAAFGSAVSFPVAAGSSVTNTLTITSNGAAGGVYYPVLTATSGSLVHSVTLILTVMSQSSDSIVLTDIYLTGGLPTLRLLLPDNLSAPQVFDVKRNGTIIGQVTNNVCDDSSAQFNSNTQNPVSYSYTSKQADSTYKDGNGYTQTILGATGSCTVVPVKLLATDNQSVDSRLDPRYSTNVLVNHNFGTTANKAYRGGLYAGFVSDNSRVGRSLIKFVMPPLASGQHAWRVGRVFAYPTYAFAPATSTSIYCQRVSDMWDQSTVTWSLAPAMASAASGAGIAVTDGSLNTWIGWPMFADVYSALTNSNGVLSVGLASTSETSNGWIYFAKKEYDPALAPFVLYAYGATN